MRTGKTARSRERAERGRSSRNGRSPKGGELLSKGSILLRAWRKQQGMTQWQATQYFGFGYEKVSGFELGYRRPSLEVAVQIRDRTGIPAETWMEPAPPSALVEPERVRATPAA